VQADLYKATAEPLVKGLFEGQNGPSFTLFFCTAIFAAAAAADNKNVEQWIERREC